MTARLVNVRLDAEHLRKVKVLREHGVVLSSLVRETIDERYAALAQNVEPHDVANLVRDLFERYPDAPVQPARDYDVHDARQARDAVRAKLSRRRSHPK